MKWPSATLAASLLGTASAVPYTHDAVIAAILKEAVKRAAPANQPHGYTPQTTGCPSATPTVRSASDLSQQETEWLDVRRKATIDPMRDLLSRMNITGLDTDQYINTHQNNVSALPNIGIAVSGGGYRAMLNGAGIIQAFDSRTPTSRDPGQLGGLLQSTTYLSGLSGGSWLVGSLYSNNFTSVNDILAQDTDDDSGSLWQFGNSIFEGPDTGGIQLLDSVGYYAALVDQVNGKKDAGFNTTITDYWGRALSYQLINATDGGPAYTYSSIAQQDWFTSGSAPLSLIVTDSRSPGQKIVSTNSTIFTITPWELGSDDPTLYAFAPLQYVGTDFNDGTPRNDDQCVVGFDSCSFVMGTSSSLFNSILTTIDQANTTGLLSSALKDALQSILSSIGEDDDDIADWVNPFYGYNNDSNVNANVETLTLVDGGEDGQNIPFHPLIQPNRHVDVIFAVDSSADTNTTFPTSNSAQNWPDGISIITTYERSLSDIGNGTVFPAVPGIDTFFNQGLNNRPTFFGCDARNLSGPAPLVVYMPNAPYVYYSNTSTFLQLAYNDTERDAMILNGYNMATQGNSTLDSQWPACVGCAILSRSFDRTGTQVPDICNQCFDRYCWDGTTNTTAPGDYVPPFKLPDDEVNVTSGVGRLSSSTVLAVATAILLGSFML